MGVLRIKENVEELLEKDPYELFTLDEPHRVGRRMRPEFFGAAFIGVLIAFAVAFFTFWNVQQDAKDQADAPYAYFEVKAIDPDGRLVAGALVKEGDKVLGVTDSFGEWRRFMRVKPGSTVTLSLSKKAPNGSFTAVKNMAVPMAMPKGGDLELTGSVQLTRSGARGVPAAKKAVNTNVESAQAPAEAEATQIPVVKTEPAAPAEAGVLDLSRIWVMTEGAVSPELGEVLAAVRRRVRELGVRVDPQGAWRLKLTQFPTGGETKALIQVESVYDDGSGRPKRLFSYLRNFQDTSLQTARDVLWAATTHIERPYHVVKREGAWLVEDEPVKLLALAPGRHVFDAGGIGHRILEGKDGAFAGMLLLEASNTEPCATGDRCQVTTGGVTKSSPVPGWTKMKMKVFGADDGETLVYASGYEARRVQDKLYEYWGTPNGGANVTVIRAGKMIHRGRIQNGGASLPVVSLPTLPLSRR